MKQLYSNHVESKALKFLLTFKLSQDHLETLFSLIRSMGGCNDNPNCVQFKRSMKGILMHNELKASVHGNCINDNIALVGVSQKSASTSKKNE